MSTRHITKLASRPSKLPLLRLRLVLRRSTRRLLPVESLLIRRRKLRWNHCRGNSKRRRDKSVFVRSNCKMLKNADCMMNTSSASANGCRTRRTVFDKKSSRNNSRNLKPESRASMLVKLTWRNWIATAFDISSWLSLRRRKMNSTTVSESQPSVLTIWSELIAGRNSSIFPQTMKHRGSVISRSMRRTRRIPWPLLS
ncbi:hypothetical protein EMPG_10151 [Blastomyces silverae]|uniref:Uncharacterized protein n=1 Tax=Blastomyces silverae TaxID=2060906 RepID=A0A0H1BB54_9EURO|nr:hypothetical protein EMPG_10151 [Blastomyces silverae]